jgi:hypothetical protein
MLNSKFLCPASKAPPNCFSLQIFLPRICTSVQLQHKFTPTHNTSSTSSDPNRRHDYLQGKLHSSIFAQQFPAILPCTRKTSLISYQQDLLTDDEIISDSYNLKEIDGVVYEADCKNISVGGESFDTGANASAEEAEEGTDDAAQTVIDVVHSFRLTSVPFDKKAYLGHLKDYMKKVKTSLKDNGASDDTVKEFETGASAYAKKIIANFKDYDFYIGESMDPDGM